MRFSDHILPLSAPQILSASAHTPPPQRTACSPKRSCLCLCTECGLQNYLALFADSSPHMQSARSSAFPDASCSTATRHGTLSYFVFAYCKCPIPSERSLSHLHLPEVWICPKWILTMCEHQHVALFQIRFDIIFVKCSLVSHH